MKQSFYSHGKLLLTAEYLVLDGVQALALPTKKGQWLYTEKNDTDYITWKSLDEHGNYWFETLLISEEDIIKPVNEEDKENPIVNTLANILNAAKQLNPKFLPSKQGYSTHTKLEFNRYWGLGTSSTLINNIAQWAEIDAFQLLDKSFGGSGYDIACAQQGTPIVYKRTNGAPHIKSVTFDPPYKENLFFVYLNQKQDSKQSIKHYQSLPLKDFDKAETLVNEITNKVLEATTLGQFKELMEEHEHIISKIIKTATVKSELFEDYPGCVKSLGGWGGDFVLVTGTSEDMEYFRNKGYTTIIPFEDMVL